MDQTDNKKMDSSMNVILILSLCIMLYSVKSLSITNLDAQYVLKEHPHKVVNNTKCPEQEQHLQQIRSAQPGQASYKTNIGKIMFKKNNDNPRHFIEIDGDKYRCSIGYAGVTENKKEGDRSTPLGTFQIRRIYYRPDRITPDELKTNIELIPLSKDDGWCDDVNSPRYNQFVKLPFQPSHENLWREDDLYDIICVLGYNDAPVIKGKGSAIFLHISRKDYSPTVGCIALSKEDLLKFLSRFSKNDEIKTTLSGDCEVTRVSH
jgi:L,D-peptidoglycan transpeptidase YkuD (ErfK/YbiS/YcfS/YnhG family)